MSELQQLQNAFPCDVALHIARVVKCKRKLESSAHPNVSQRQENVILRSRRRWNLEFHRRNPEVKTQEVHPTVQSIKPESAKTVKSPRHGRCSLLPCLPPVNTRVHSTSSLPPADEEEEETQRGATAAKRSANISLCSRGRTACWGQRVVQTPRPFLFHRGFFSSRPFPSRAAFRLGPCCCCFVHLFVATE